MGKREKRKRRAKKAAAAGRSAASPTVMTSQASPPPRERLRTGKLIAIGHVEKLAGGRELRCYVDGPRVSVAVFEGDVRVEPSLSLDCPPAERVAGHAFDEGDFSRVLDSYYLLSPWHDGEHTSLVLTIDCLRTGSERELLTCKDL